MSFVCARFQKPASASSTTMHDRHLRPSLGAGRNYTNAATLDLGSPLFTQSQRELRVIPPCSHVNTPSRFRAYGDDDEGVDGGAKERAVLVEWLW